MIVVTSVMSCGSSPLARGTPVAADVVDQHRRFIPAGAGNTIPFSSSGVGQTVHPRWRGEHIGILCRGCCHDGSSPLARGTPIDAQKPDVLQRFIPAGAGNTFLHQS